MMSQTETQTAIKIFTDISKSKSNQIMKFGQLIEYNTRNTLLQKSGRN